MTALPAPWRPEVTGQTRRTHYYHLVATATIDLDVYRALERRKDVLTYLLENFR